MTASPSHIRQMTDARVIAWLDIRTSGLDWQNRIVATNPQYVKNNGPENFVPLGVLSESNHSTDAANNFGAGGDWNAMAHVRFLRAQAGACSGFTADLIEKLYLSLDRTDTNLRHWRDECGKLSADAIKWRRLQEQAEDL